MSRKMIQCLAAVAATAVVGGCFEVKTVVHVEKDGSGTVEQTIYYQEMDLGAMGFQLDFEGGPGELNGEGFEFDGEGFEFNGEGAEFEGGFEFGGEAPDAEADGFDFAEGGFPFGGQAEKPTEEERLAATRAQAEKTAASMGEGVTVQTVEALPPKDGRNGLRIVYAFTDINTLRVASLPEVDLGGGMSIGTAGAGMGMGDIAMDDFAADGQFGQSPPPAADEQHDTVRFQYSSEPTPTLTIITPDVTSPADDAAPSMDDDPQAQAMAKMMMTQMFDGMRMEFRVRVAGKITDTNATYVSRSGNVVGLYRMDFDSLVKNPQALDKLLAMDEVNDPAAVKQHLQDPLLAQHLKVEMNETIEVAFE